MTARQPLSKGEKRLLIATVLFVIVAGAIGWWFYSINVNPVVNIPEPPPMPNPNARDIYLAAQGLKVPSLPSIEPAGRHVDIDRVYSSIQAGKIVPPAPGERPPALADMQALMAKNAPVFAKVQQGVACEYRETPSRSFQQLFPHFAKLRDLARTMLADGDVKCASGDWDGGAERFVDILRVGNDIPRGGVLISMLVGVAIQAIGRADAWNTLDHVSGAEARRAARRLEEIAAHRVSYADILQEEKWATQAGLLELFNTPRWRTQGMLGEVMSESPTAFFRIQIVSKRTAMTNYTRYMDALIANAKQPYTNATKVPPVPHDPVSQMFAPVFTKARIKDVMASTENDLLMVSFALRAYLADHGKYPAGLQALVPAYLKAIPADPFTANGTLRYKRTGKTYVLYSVGPNGADDGGTPSADGQSSGPGAPVSSLRTGSTGDIVAGVNRY